MQDKGTGC